MRVMEVAITAEKITKGVNAGFAFFLHSMTPPLISLVTYNSFSPSVVEGSQTSLER